MEGHLNTVQIGKIDRAEIVLQGDRKGLHGEVFCWRGHWAHMVYDGQPQGSPPLPLLYTPLHPHAGAKHPCTKCIVAE